MQYIQGTFDNVSNTYVIFEMQQSLGMSIINEGEEGIPLFNLFQSMFSSMKGNGCEIMFIFGTEEERWAEYNDFLDYVDIHINTDILYLFLGNVFTDMKEESEDWRLKDVAFIFDAGLTSHPEGSSVQEGWFFSNWFIPYIKQVYKEEFSGGEYAEEVFEDNRILCHVQGNIYYDAVYDTEITFTAESMAEQLSGYILCPIGYYPAENDYGWLLEMENLRDALWEYFPIYVYNTGSRVPLWGEAIYTSGQFNSIREIIEEFVNGEDMGDYDNWTGRCDITHFPMEISEDGWMSMPSHDSPFPNCWKCCMTDDEYKFYTNQEGEGEWSLVW